VRNIAAATGRARDRQIRQQGVRRVAWDHPLTEVSPRGDGSGASARGR
jgi:hypothetical protein